MNNLHGGIYAGLAGSRHAEGVPVEQSPARQADPEIYQSAVAALLGQSPNPKQALLRFVMVYGENALRQLMREVQGGGAVAGPGGPKDDAVMGTIDGHKPVALSNGEFVMDAPTVTAMGGGDNQAGAQHLEALRQSVRQQAY